ncbi:Phosphotransferase enzyme family protein [Rubripirellula lacrimiformis]|uniref:Phosphotransferase enzyme family protein n=1 Tax=Rubripirellula lacrimiformis TaxID=1930273 RepID=A0A517NLU2_9BACT|nr:oxidoreductase family protein [Rubripirellula lacrimiformis]QDT08043.1 Phosphotransferase enzyme family protein [Rubripirellula lacrimiformis]
MNPAIADRIRQVMSARSLGTASEVQSLWSGYGQILRVPLVGADVASVIVKHVVPPTDQDHPRGWNGDQSHQRKLRSYQVESCWYQDWSPRCDDACRVPHCFAVERTDAGFLIILEDLDAAGLDRRWSGHDQRSIELGLTFLAHFHARFLGQTPVGLWPVGTYWHLETRPDEWQAMVDSGLKRHAASIDAKLRKCRFQTLVHGDAKVANFCYSADGHSVAAVDFQYVGGGCGMKDVAYFLGSCLDESECERQEERLLSHYFETLRRSLRPTESAEWIDQLESEWRQMYRFAWADFTRFMMGWCPGHHKLNRYSRRIADEVVAAIESV